MTDGVGSAAVDVVHFMRRKPDKAFSIERVFDDLRGSFPDTVRVRTWECKHESCGVWGRLRDVIGARRAEGEINHVTGDVHYLTYLLSPSRTVLTVHDLISFRRQRGIRRWIIWLFWYYLPVRCCNQIVAISESTREQLVEDVGCPPEKVRVIYNPVSPEFFPGRSRVNSKNARLLVVGTDAHKNLDRIVESIAGLECTLVVVGRISESFSRKLAGHSIRYENYFRVSREELAEIYRSVDLLIFPSLYEGFGLPIVEAQASGVPVLTSNLSSMPEVARDGAHYVDPTDPKEIRLGIDRILNDESYRRELVDRGFKNVDRFRVGTIADQYAGLYFDMFNADRAKRVAAPE